MTMIYNRKNSSIIDPTIMISGGSSQLSMIGIHRSIYLKIGNLFVHLYFFLHSPYVFIPQGLSHNVIFLLFARSVSFFFKFLSSGIYLIVVSLYTSVEFFGRFSLGSLFLCVMGRYILHVYWDNFVSFPPLFI